VHDRSGSRVRHRLRAAAAFVVAGAVVVPLAWMWWASRLPDAYSLMDTGHMDYGGGPALPMDAKVSVDDLVSTASGPADLEVVLTTRTETLTLASGRKIQAFTVNGTSPGPEIRAHVGDIVEVTLHNESVTEGATIHWHGVDVPNAEDGVAGVTQDAVPMGSDFTYRFVPDRAGTFWYHSHQESSVQVSRGLFGALVILPAGPDAAVADGVDVVALTHTFGGERTINGVAAQDVVDAPAGSSARVRVINTDNETLPVWIDGATYEIAAIDGSEIARPDPVENRYIGVPAGGRADLTFTVPTDGAVVHIAGASMGVGTGGAPADAAARPATRVDLLHYGSGPPDALTLRRPDRSFDYALGRRPGFVNGRPGMWWSINGALYPRVPMFIVDRGDVVSVTFTNSSGDNHPMHLHGHRALVVSRNGGPSDGSPWWIDSLDVGPGETYEVMFTADNTGVWMFHCHDLPHAHEGLVAHLMYAGVTSPYVHGGPNGNAPE